MAERGRVIVITGAMAAGKSTVAELLAHRLPRSVHVRGDVFRRMVVNGRVEMSPDPDPEALAQLHLRYALAARTADTYAAAGFDAILQDVIIGPELAGWLEQSGVRHVVYSSCNAESLARDLALMPSLRPVEARVLDMFPHTTHYEVMVLLSRR